MCELAPLTAESDSCIHTPGFVLCVYQSTVALLVLLMFVPVVLIVFPLAMPQHFIFKFQQSVQWMVNPYFRLCFVL